MLPYFCLLFGPFLIQYSIQAAIKMVGGSIYIKISSFDSAKRELNEGYIMPYYDNSGIFRRSLYIPDATLYSLHPSAYILFVG